MEHPSIIDIRDTCTGCGACVDSCKKACITIVQDEYGFYYPQVDTAKCIMCGACSNACHVLDESNRFETPQWWNKSSLCVFQAKDKNIVENSTSGGAFTFFASKCLKEGGVVFASRYNGDVERLEFSNTDLFELGEFRKSRYIESCTNGVFDSIKSQLKEGRSVLFCGTPCQVSGLKKYLGSMNANNLLTINFICHGVPSNKHFHLWLHSKFPNIKKIANVDFRYKNKKEGWGWHEMCLSILEESGNRNNIPYTESTYYLSFYQNDILRKSCYNCKIINGLSADITLGDYWGVNKDRCVKDDNTGLSLVILHSAKANSYIKDMESEGLLSKLEYKDIEYAFHPRRYSLEKRAETEKGIKKYGYIKHLNKRYMKYILKYKMEKMINLHGILKWIKK